MSFIVTFDELQKQLQEAFPQAEISLSGNLYHVHIEIIDPQFYGLSRIKRDQLVYAHLQPLLASGALHAISLKTLAAKEPEA